MTADPDALVAARAQRRRGVLRRVGTGRASATTSPGVNHVLPTARHRAVRERAARRRLPQARARRARSTEAGLRQRRGPRRRPSPRRRASPRTPTPWRVAALAGHRTRRERTATAPRRTPRRSPRARGLPLAPARRLGAAQHQREPVPAARRLRRRVARRAPRARRCTAIPTVARGELRAALGASPRAAGRAGVLRQRVQRGAADAPAHLRRRGPSRARVRADLRAALAHRPHHRHRGRRRRARATTSRSIADAAPGAPGASTRPTIVFVCSPNNPTGTVEPRGDRRGAPRRRTDGSVVVVDEAYGEFAPLERARARRATTCRSSSCAPTRRCGRWPRCGSASRSRRRGSSRSSRRSCCRTTSRSPRRSPARVALELRRRDGRPGRIARRGARAARRAARRASTASPCYPSGANFVLFRVDGRRPRAAGSELVERGVLVRDFSRWPRLEDCLRVTVGTPEENDAFLAALARVAPGGGRLMRRARRTQQPRRRRRPRSISSLDVDGARHRSASRPASRSSTTCSSSSASTAASTCTIEAHGRPRGRPAPHRRGRRHRARHRAARRRSATRPASGGSRPRSSRSTRRSCRSRSTSRAGRSSSTRSIRSSEWIGTFDPQLCEEFWRAFVVGARASRCTSARSPGRNGHHVIEASFKGVARCAARRGADRGHGRPVDQGHAVTAPFELYPAIDLRGGRCVRLRQGDFDGRDGLRRRSRRGRTASSRPPGARWIHVVDLDAARTGERGEPRADRGDLRRGAVPGASRRWSADGRSGRRAARRRRRPGRRRHRGGRAPRARRRARARCTRVASRSGSTRAAREVAVRGWVEGSGRRPRRRSRGASTTSGVAALIVTEIGRDGTIEGPDLEQLAAVLAATDVPVVASGGVGHARRPPRARRAAPRGPARLAGVIVGPGALRGAVHRGRRARRRSAGVRGRLSPTRYASREARTRTRFRTPFRSSETREAAHGRRKRRDRRRIPAAVPRAARRGGRRIRRARARVRRRRPGQLRPRTSPRWRVVVERRLAFLERHGTDATGHVSAGSPAATPTSTIAAVRRFDDPIGAADEEVGRAGDDVDLRRSSRARSPRPPTPGRGTRRAGRARAASGADRARWRGSRSAKRNGGAIANHPARRSSAWPAPCRRRRTTRRARAAPCRREFRCERCHERRRPRRRRAARRRRRRTCRCSMLDAPEVEPQAGDAERRGGPRTARRSPESASCRRAAGAGGTARTGRDGMHPRPCASSASSVQAVGGRDHVGRATRGAVRRSIRHDAVNADRSRHTVGSLPFGAWPHGPPGNAAQFDLEELVP